MAAIPKVHLHTVVPDVPLQSQGDWCSDDNGRCIVDFDAGHNALGPWYGCVGFCTSTGAVDIDIATEAVIFRIQNEVGVAFVETELVAFRPVVGFPLRVVDDEPGLGPLLDTCGVCKAACD